MLEKFDNKKDILEVANKFDITLAISEEEFDNTLDYVMASLLFGTRWEGPLLANPKLRREIPAIFEMPLICKADDCEYAPLCPVIKHMKQVDKVKIIGTACRVEQKKAAELFSALVKSTDLGTEETVDILNAAEIVRLTIYKSRIDRRIAALSSMMEKKVAGVNPQTGQAYYNEEPTQLLKVSEGINKQIMALQSQLMASRKDKMNFLKDTKQNVASLKDMLLGKLNGEFIDAEFEDVEEE